MANTEPPGSMCSVVETRAGWVWQCLDIAQVVICAEGRAGAGAGSGGSGDRSIHRRGGALALAASSSCGGGAGHCCLINVGKLGTRNARNVHNGGGSRSKHRVSLLMLRAS